MDSAFTNLQMEKPILDSTHQIRSMGTVSIPGLMGNHIKDGGKKESSKDMEYSINQMVPQKLDNGIKERRLNGSVNKKFKILIINIPRQISLSKSMTKIS